MCRRTSVSGDTLVMSVGYASPRGGVTAVVQQFESVHEQILVLAERDGRPPAFPAVRVPVPRVELRAEQAEDDELLGGHSGMTNIMSLAEKIKPTLISDRSTMDDRTPTATILYSAQERNLTSRHLLT